MDDGLLGNNILSLDSLTTGSGPIIRLDPAATAILGSPLCKAETVWCTVTRLDEHAVLIATEGPFQS